MSAKTDFLKTLSLFKGLDEATVDSVAGETRELAFDRGQIIFLEGDPCQGLYVVKEGQVRIFKTSPDGREQVLLIARPGDTFNDVPVFDAGPNAASASALEPSVVYLIPGETLFSLMKGSPVAIAVIKMLAARLRHLNLMVESLSFRTVMGRLARLLLDMAVVENGQAPIKHLTQEEMASRIGTVRDVVGRALRQMEKDGMLRIERHRIMVVDAEKLRELV